MLLGRIADAFMRSQIVNPVGSSLSDTSFRPVTRQSVKEISTPTESYEAREKYNNLKGISSDHFESAQSIDTISASQLDKYSTATSFSSDMFNDKTEATNGFSVLKDSVKSFFDDIQRRIN